MRVIRNVSDLKDSVKYMTRVLDYVEWQLGRNIDFSVNAEYWRHYSATSSYEEVLQKLKVSLPKDEELVACGWGQFDQYFVYCIQFRNVITDLVYEHVGIDIPTEAEAVQFRLFV